MCTSSSSSYLSPKQDVFPYVFPHPGLEVAGGRSSRDQCAISPNRIAPAPGPGLCLLSSIFSPRVLVQLGDTLAYFVAASLCPEGCSELVSLASVGGWCDHRVNVLCYSQAAHLCSPLLTSPLPVPSFLPHIHGCLPFFQSCKDYSAPGTLGGEAAAAQLQSQSLLQSHAGTPHSAHPFHGSRLCTTALCLVLGVPSCSPFPTAPLSPGRHR